MAPSAGAVASVTPSAERPLEGVQVLILGGIGPVPFAGFVLADLGATVTRLERPGADNGEASHNILWRDQPGTPANLKDPADLDRVRTMLTEADIVLEGFRPGVAERLGLGPADAQALNPAVVYGRMTGWGQDGPMAMAAGHDINYIALSGALEPIAGTDGTPVPPLNMLGDFAGGSMYLVSGVLSGLYRAQLTGEGCVVDAAIVDGAAHLTGMLHSMRKSGTWDSGRGKNLLDGGAPFYRVYETADGKYMSVGPLEPKFYAALVDTLGLTEELAGVDQNDETHWPATRERFAQVFRTKTRDEWVAAFDGVDACAAPVIAPDEVLGEPHLAARGTYVEVDGHIEPAPAPRIAPLPHEGVQP
ncbi:CoA transferase [Corynebacterium sp. TA-R-1]|uniref:CoA transferase n=1 Tax=Corynebacterium stercoris TaxID=2943490 RepID=A0ABT1G3Q2_9CORY|nr:CaiB/BaiF CoA-transferase family protein [Corynebacterium stercoris]MCP1388662.1 CoA transferase [Corynebacterium stercoris]